MPNLSPVRLISVCVLAVLAVSPSVEVLAQETPGGPTPDASPPPVSASLQSGNAGRGGGQTDFNTTADNSTMLVGCTASSTLPDLTFRNIGNTTIPAGTAITWLVPGGKHGGTFFTQRDVKPGESLSLAGVLAATLGKDGVCLSTLRR